MKPKIKYLTPLEMKALIESICVQFCITLEELINEGNKTENCDIKEARAIVCYYLFLVNGYNPSSLGRSINTSRSNVYHASKRVADEMQFNKDYKEKVERIINNFEI